MADKLVFDLSQETEGAANIFIKKDWVNILDNMNGNYSSNQSVIDTSSISNSNKYAGYREGYLLMPLLLTVASTTPASNSAFAPADALKSADYSIGLKSFFGSMIHSLGLDLQGSSIIQQTAFSNMWNSFKLMTSLSWEDVKTIGSTIGFYPDDALSWSYYTADSPNGRGVCNNTNWAPATGGALQTVVNTAFNNYKSNAGNEGFLKRQQFINYDTAGIPGSGTYNALLTPQGSINVWKSYISTKRTGVDNVTCGLYQVSISAIIYLRHLHSFFNYMPLLKGIYMRLTLNLNNSSIGFSSNAGDDYLLTSVSNSVGGVVPIMLSSAAASNGGAAAFGNTTYRANVSAGSRCLDTQITSLGNFNNSEGTLAKSIYLYVPLYSFNPVFESAYLSSPVKTIKYEDLYQYQITNIAAGNQINSLVSNGISDVRSVLCLPYFSASTNAVLTGGGFLPAYQSPFDPAGCGPTSPLCFLNNFNVVVSGQNAIYNSIRYTGWELFSQQVLGANSVNGGLIDGLTSSLIGQQDWEMEYCYHYVDVSRMLDVERAVPKSISITGQNQSAQTIDLMVFVSYGQTVSIDALSGARV